MARQLPRLKLAALRRGVRPGVTPAKGGSLAEAACVCLHALGHTPGSSMILLDGDTKKTYELVWDTPTQEMCNCHNDAQDATEEGAYAVSFLTVLDVTDYTVIRKSRKGTGVDWFLAYKDELFQDAARLEVSGILRGTVDQLAYRVNQKLQQTSLSDGQMLPAFVSVTEFGSPRTRLVRKP
jgi:hypothetical protein